MGFHRLVPHPKARGRSVTSLRAQITTLDSAELAIEFEVTSSSGLVLPKPSNPQRTDGLWQTTCFELFLKPGGAETYFEINCSPSSAWAAYSFAAYRDGMRDLPMRFDPEIWVSASGDHFWLYAELDGSLLGRGAANMGLCAVIEENDGTKSYWALNHPPDAPDFHHPDCFALNIPASQ